MITLNTLSLKASSETELPAVAQQLMTFAGKQRIFIFQGQMGAGKTTFIKAFCKVLGIEDTVSSPTFSLVNQYDNEAITVYHFDFYRIKSEEEAYDFGYEDYFYSGDYCLIEWPEKIPNLLPLHYIKVGIQVVEDGSRDFQFFEV